MRAEKNCLLDKNEISGSVNNGKSWALSTINFNKYELFDTICFSSFQIQHN